MESIIVRATREDVLHFLSITPIWSYGFWSYGYSVGCGHGYSKGYGFGDNCNSGFSDGIGHGYGTGSGGCPEQGHGCGFGCGSGGDKADEDENYKLCKDIKSLNGNIVDYIDSIPTIITQVYGNVAYGYIVKNDLTMSPCFIARFGNSLSHGDTLKKAVADARDKEIKNISQIMNQYGYLH